MRGAISMRRSGQASVPGLGTPVAVALDERAIPTIRADSFLDALRAQGYLHAQERFFQMDLLRRQSAGELAELFGERALEFELAVEMILDDTLVAPRHEDEMFDARLERLIDHILDERPVDDRQHLLRHGLGRGQEARAETGDREDGLADFLHRTHSRAGDLPLCPVPGRLAIPVLDRHGWSGMVPFGGRI